MRPLAPLFSLSDVERANAEWGANCGPAALAAIAGLTLDGVRGHIPGFDDKRHTSPSMMFAALRSLRDQGSICDYMKDPSMWPRWGLCRIQWDGPWMKPGVPERARYKYTHWVGAGEDRDEERGVFDINAMNNGSGWCSLEDWSKHLAPHLAKSHDKRSTGAWSVTHAIEVTK